MTTRTLIIAGTAFACLLSVLYAQTDQTQSSSKQTPTLAPISPKQPQSDRIVRTKTFYLKDGTVVMGRVISEDRNQITLEHFNQSPVAVYTYAKRQIVARTTHTQIVSELDYYKKCAALFASKAWDFRDDPDDFIQSIRLYEKAKQILSEAAQPDAQEINEIDKKIAQVKADREIWITEAKSRGKLSKLQALAVIDQRMAELKQEIGKNAAEVSAIKQTIGKNYKALNQRISDSDRTFEDLHRRLQRARDEIEKNKRDIDDLDRKYRRHGHPRVRIVPHKHDPPERK